MSSFKAGSIFYTVEVDSQAMRRVLDDLRNLKNVVKLFNKGVGGSTPELLKLNSQLSTLSGKMKTLESDFKDGTITEKAYADGMDDVYAEAGRLRGQLDVLSGSIGSTAAEQAAFAQVLSKSATVMEKSGRVSNETGGDIRRLGMDFDNTTDMVFKLGSEVRRLVGRLDAGQVSTKEIDGQYKQLKGTLEAFEAQLLDVARTTNLTSAESRKLSSVLGQVTRHTLALEKGMTRTQGKLTSMALATQLSYGATTLLNDRIFQLSPALGILTNQLNFTTRGLRAFLAAILPIVAVAGTIIAVIAAIAASIKEAVKLEAALANVQKTTNLTNDELKVLTRNFQELSKELPTSSIELLEIATVAGQLGIKGVENISKFTEAVSMLSTATNVVGSQGAESLARFLQATGVATEDLGAAALQVGNVLNELENTSAATADEILKMTSYTQGLSSQAGATQSQILALNAAILSLGVQSEAGGSAVVRTVSKIQKAAVDGGDALETMARVSGVTVESFVDIVNSSPVEALELLAIGMNNIAENGGNLNQVLSDLGINEIRERRTMLALAQGADVLSQSIDNANMEAIRMLSLQEEVGIQANTTEALMKRLGNRFMILAQNTGTALLPAFKGLVVLTIALVDAVNFLIEPWALLVDHLRAGPMGRLAEEMKAAVSETNNLVQASRSAEQALGDLSEVTGENGLIEVLQRFSLSLDTAGRESLANFTKSTLGPLLAQGELQQAILLTIEYLEKQLMASKIAVRDSLSGQLEINTSQLANTITQIRELENEIGDARAELEEMVANKTVLGPFADVIIQDARENIDSLVAGLDELIQARNDLTDNRLEIRSNLDEASASVSELREQIAELGQMTDYEAILERIAELFGGDSTSQGFEYTSPDTESNKRTIADVFADLEAAGNAATRKAEAFGNTYEATLQSVQTRSQLVASALDELFEMGLTGADSRVQYLIARMTDLKDEGEDLIRQFDSTESALEAARQRRIAFEQGEGAPAVTQEDIDAAIKSRKDRNQAILDFEAESLARRTEFLRAEEDAGMMGRREMQELDKEERLRLESEYTDAWIEYQESRIAAMREEAEEQQRFLDLRIQSMAASMADERAMEDAGLLPGAESTRKRWEDQQAELEAAIAFERAVLDRRAEYISSSTASLREEEDAGTMGMLEVRALARQAELRREVEDYENHLTWWEEYQKSRVEAARQAEKEIQEIANLRAASLARRTGGLRADEDAGMMGMAELVRLREEAALAKRPVAMLTQVLNSLGQSVGGSFGAILTASSSVVQSFDDMERSGISWAKELREGTNGVAASIANLANVVGNALPEQNSFANKAVEGFYALGGAVLSLFPPFKELGPIVTAMGKVVSRSLGDMANGVKQVRKQLEEAAGSATGLSRDLIDAFGVRATERVSRGGFLGFLGFKKSALNQEFFNAMLDTAGSIASGFSQALSSGVQAALSGEQNWAQNFRKGLTKTIVDIIIQAMIDAAIMKGMIQDFIEEFTLLLFDDEGDITTSTLNKALSFAEKNIDSVVSSAERVVKKITDSVKSRFGDVYKEAAGELGFLTEEFVGRLEEAFTETFERQKGRGKKVKTYTVTVFDEEGFAEALNIADTIASGFTSGFRQGIKDAISGNQDWKTNLRQSLTDTLMNVIIDSFLQTAIIDGIFGNLMINFTKEIQKGNIDAALGIIADQLPGVVEDAQRLIEEFVGGLPPELQPDGSLGGGTSGGGGTTISEITGPTRDLLVDLLRPLSILPSWTQMIQDIRNDVRAMRLAAVGELQPAALMTATSAPNLSTSAASTTVFNLSNVTITTNADNVQTLSRDISAYANKQRRGGK